MQRPRCASWWLQQPTDKAQQMHEAFKDRVQAGQCLGQQLRSRLPQLLAEHAVVLQQQASASAAGHSDEARQHQAPDPESIFLNDTVVLGLARGGMPVADAVALALHCPCDAYVVRKVGAPRQAEYGIGAIAEGEQVLMNIAAVEDVGATEQEIADTIQAEQEELQRRVQAYRRGRAHIPVKGKTVILVDDGLATGITARAACRAMRQAGAAVVVLAAPVGSPVSVKHLQQEGVADLVVCLHTPVGFKAVGAYYQDFTQTTDEEVIDILRKYEAVNTQLCAAMRTPSPATASIGADASSAHIGAPPATTSTDTAPLGTSHTTRDNTKACQSTVSAFAQPASAPIQVPEVAAGGHTSTPARAAAGTDLVRCAGDADIHCHQETRVYQQCLSSNIAATGQQQRPEQQQHKQKLVVDVVQEVWSAADSPLARTSSLAAALSQSLPVTSTPTEAARAGAQAGEDRAPAAGHSMKAVQSEEVAVTVGQSGVQLLGSMTVPQNARGLVVFALVGGSIQDSPCTLAAALQHAGFATLLLNLLTPGEAEQHHHQHHRQQQQQQQQCSIDIPVLASRLMSVVEWLEAEGAPTAGRCPPDMPIGFFGASAGGGAALWAAAYLGPRVSAVVVLGGRPDLAACKLPAVSAPALLLVGSGDSALFEVNNMMLQTLGSSDSSRLVQLQGSGGLCGSPEETGSVAEEVETWFRLHMVPTAGHMSHV